MLHLCHSTSSTRPHPHPPLRLFLSLGPSVCRLLKKSDPECMPATYLAALQASYRSMQDDPLPPPEGDEGEWGGEREAAGFECRPARACRAWHRQRCPLHFSPPPVSCTILAQPVHFACLPHLPVLSALQSPCHLSRSSWPSATASPRPTPASTPLVSGTPPGRAGCASLPRWPAPPAPRLPGPCAVF